MAVAADRAGELDVGPSLEEVRELAREHTLVPLRHTFIADTETPVSAYLKLRGEGPSFLLESAEQGQRFGRWSFLGVQPRTVMRLDGGTLTVDGEPRAFEDPYAAVASELERYRLAPLDGLPPFAGGAVGLFGYDLVRSAEPTVGEPNPDDVGLPDLALMVSDVLLAFDHFTHTVTVLAQRVRATAATWTRATRAPSRAIADVRERLAAPVPRAHAGRREPPEFVSNIGADGYAAGGRAREGVHPRRRRLPGGAEPALVRRRCRVEAFSIYRGLRTINPSPYMYFLDFEDFQIAGASPEPLVKVDGQARGAAPDRRHAPARRDRGGGHAPRRGAARRREGARRARDARGPRPQRPRARVRVRQRRRRRADGRRDLLARDAHRLVGVGDAARRRQRRWTRCARRCPPGRCRARRRSARCRSSTSSSPSSAARTAARSATSPTRATSTPASTSARPWSRTAACTLQAGGGIVADSDADYEVRETEAKAGAVRAAIELACGQADWP